MIVIAERDKTIGKIILVIGIILSVLSVSMLGSWIYIFTLVFGIIFLIFGFYLVLLPKCAIVKEDDKLILCHVFHKKRIPLSRIEYVSYHELGTWQSRGGELVDVHILKNDIRTLTITVKEERKLRHFYVWLVLNASGTKVSIDGLVEKEKKHLLEIDK